MAVLAAVLNVLLLSEPFSILIVVRVVGESQKRGRVGHDLLSDRWIQRRFLFDRQMVEQRLELTNQKVDDKY